MTLAELNTDITRRLAAALGDREGKATARLVMEDVLQADPTRIFTRGELELEPESVDKVNRIVRRICDGEPPQYAVGRARFMGMDLSVTPATLIPRPETEGLVDMITDDYSGQTDLDVLDIGTGSGCIAIALARGLAASRHSPASRPSISATTLSRWQSTMRQPCTQRSLSTMSTF